MKDIIVDSEKMIRNGRKTAVCYSLQFLFTCWGSAMKKGSLGGQPRKVSYMLKYSKASFYAIIVS